VGSNATNGTVKNCYNTGPVTIGNGNYSRVGGIVGENHGIIEQCTVEFDEETQKAFDDTILSNDSNNGTFYLFDMAEGEPYYAVAIGGIAGSSENGVIIDSYSKVNVVKSLAYIAGGIVGYAKNYNYLGYVYNTGAVYGQLITGGIIGLQVNEYNAEDSVVANSVHLNNAISLTNWNASNDVLNVRDQITIKLYNNYKFIKLYNDNLSKDERDDLGISNYKLISDFYIKMPEVGNAPIECVIDGYPTSVAENLKSNYRTTHTNFYVGSVVGKAVLRNSLKTEEIVNGAGSDQDQVHIFKDNTLIDELYNGNNNVISSTLGLVTTSGDIPSGDRIDEFDKTSFTIEIGQDTKINSISYRIAYNEVGGLNEYVAPTDSSNYVDILSFNKVFTAQEYKQQILGNAYKPDSDEITSSHATKNVFSHGYDEEDRFKAKLSQNFIGDSSGKIVWTMDGLLPTYYTGVSATITEISTADELVSVWKNNVAGKTYKIVKDIEINIDSSIPGKPIEYFNGIKSLFVGEMLDSNDEIQKPTITINVPDGELSSIFNLWTGTTIQNIIFDINIDDDFNNGKDVDSSNFGLLVNTVEGVYLKDCEFNLTLNSSFHVYKGTQSNFNANNVGVMFGSLRNSNIENCVFGIVAENISVDNENITNFGLIAGNISGTNVRNCEFNINTTNITNIAISKSLEVLNIGGIAGSVTGSKFSEVQHGPSYLNVAVNYNLTEINVANMFGYAYQLNYVGTSVQETKDFTISSNQNCNISASMVIGKSYMSRVEKVVIIDESSNDDELVVNTTNSANYVSIGSIIGYDLGQSQIGRTNVVGSYADINVDVYSNNLSVGGLVGYTKTSNQLANNSFYDGDIKVKNRQIYSQIDDEIVGVYTYVGGLLGRADGKVLMQNVLSAGSITLNPGNSYSDKHSIYALGGIVGGGKGSLTLANFVSIVDIYMPSTAMDDFDDANKNGMLDPEEEGSLGNHSVSYINGEEAADALCTRYGISRSYLSRLAKRYRTYGERGMDLSYMTPAYKRQILERHLKGGETLTGLAEEASVAIDEVERWLKAYQRSGMR